MPLLYRAQTRYLYHAHIKIKLPLWCSESFFDVLFGIMERIDRQYNSYQRGSYVDLINRHAGEWVETDDVTVALLSEAKRWGTFFGGAFDITVMPLIRLWGFYRQGETLRAPTQAEIDEARRHVDASRIEIEGHRVRIAPGQEIITGSFLKAYATDQVVAALRREGITDALINAGGSTIYGLNNDRHPAWLVNVRDGEGRLVRTLRLSNRCFTTSAQSETYVTIDGRRYGHILNPLTGWPSTNRHVGLLTDSAMTGDMVSTGLFLQTPEGFASCMARLRQTCPPVEGFLTDGEGQTHATAGFNALTVTEGQGFRS